MVTNCSVYYICPFNPFAGNFDWGDEDEADVSLSLVSHNIYDIIITSGWAHSIRHHTVFDSHFVLYLLLDIVYSISAEW